MPCFCEPRLPGVVTYRQASHCWLIACLLLGLAVPAFTQQRSDPASEWEVLHNCELVPDSTADGDSFHVLHKGREYIFRLYFADAPEANDSLPERLVDQAAYFGISTNDVTKAGALAAEFTREQLTDRCVTIVTRWQNAMGRSSLARYYGVVLVGGKNLAEELVGAGLARIYGYRANWPDGPRSVTFVNQLKNLEIDARVKQRGVWNPAQFPRTRDEANTDSGRPSAPPGQATGTTAIDLNRATLAELKKLPGVGKVIAERIVAHRPYQNVEALDRVPGIGAATMERLRPLVRADPVNP